MIAHRIEALRGLMKEWGWNAAVVVGGDPHNSEYTPQRWCQRRFISGFTGSAGVVVVTAEHAGLWVDSRYHIQAARELEGSGIEMHRMISVEESGWMEWIAAEVPVGGTVGVDGLCMSSSDASRLQSLVSARSARVVSKPDFLDALWPDRPALPKDPVWQHDGKYAGMSRKDKLEWLRGVMREKQCRYALVTALDQIAWLLNIRSGDIDYCPVVISFAVVSADNVVLFAELSKFGADVRPALENDGVVLRPYGEVSDYILSLHPDGRILMDAESVNYELAQSVDAAFGPEGVVRCQSPVELAKAVKNPIETDGFRRAYVMDGIAQTRFFRWLEESMASGAVITESDAADRQRKLRAECPDFIGESFETISAYQENSALPHYSTVRGKDAVLRPHGLYLNDSGAHYRYGTTDITRTVPLGPTTQLEREDYTIVLKAMIDLAMAVFPAGTPGCRLDAVCRRPLWQTMRNFGHGTGHGVGNVLSVHEGPQTIRQNLKGQSIVPGMVTSDEPGIYREGMHGIRHENMILCVPLGENAFGSWLGFETLTCTYIDTDAVIPELLDRDEIEWLNGFNGRVCETLSPLLDRKDSDWLARKTRPISRT